MTDKNVQITLEQLKSEDNKLSSENTAFTSNKIVSIGGGDTPIGSAADQLNEQSFMEKVFPSRDSSQIETDLGKSQLEKEQRSQAVIEELDKFFESLDARKNSHEITGVLKAISAIEHDSNTKKAIAELAHGIAKSMVCSRFVYTDATAEAMRVIKENFGDYNSHLLWQGLANKKIREKVLDALSENDPTSINNLRRLIGLIEGIDAE